MTPELIAFLDKLSFTGALLFAVYFLYKDTRAADKLKVDANTEAIKLLTEQVKFIAEQQAQLISKVDQLLWRLPTTRPLNPDALKRVQEATISNPPT